MTAMSIKNFVGMMPRAPDHLLPDNAAAFADNCDFSRSQLQSLRGGQQVLSYGGAIRGMYTGDGIYWYTWDTPVVAHKSPVINEIYNRLYYIEGGIVFVTVTPESSGKAPNTGGSPNVGLRWAAGVPNPTVAPKLTLIDRSSLPDYPAAVIEFKTWYTDGAVAYGVTTVSPFPAIDVTWKRYHFIPPPPPAEAPAGAVLVVQAVATEGTKQLFSMNTATNSTNPATTSALPGGITMTLEAAGGGVYYVNFAWGVVETRAYVYTEVNAWNEESGPSPVTLISPTYMQDVQVEMTHPDAPASGYRPRVSSNIYRTYGGSQYIKAGNAPGLVFTDVARTVQSSTGTALQSLTWVVPPVGMLGLVLAPNGWFAAYAGNILFMSEPYRPHVWPYTMTFPKTITGICVGAQSIVVTTREATYIVTGPHPHSATSMTVPVPIGGVPPPGPVSANSSMCAVEGGVAFLSNDGIVVVEGSQATLAVNQRLFTREVWRAMYGDELDKMQLAYHDGCVVAANWNKAAGFVLELDEAGGAMTEYNFQHTALMRLPVLDTLYFAAGGGIYRFRDGNPLAATWRSKQFITPQYTKLGIGFARMSGSGNITVKVYADEVLLHTQVLLASDRTKYFRLPPYRGALKWQIEVSIAGAGVLEDIAFAHTADELKTV
jgi:hypothetical protein